MRRGLIHSGAWLLATGAAVTLSWWGVHTVMAGTAYDPPRALPIPSGRSLPAMGSGDGTAQSASPQSSSTHRPSRTPTAEKPSPSKTPAGRTPPRSPSRTPALPASPKPSGQVKVVNTEAGRVVFSMGKDSAKLVYAIPAAGWAMQVWNNPSWIRVEFTAGAAKLSVFCTWHDHPPAVEIIKS
ncbi:hypothetical protein [Streptomyces sp. NPDC051561]|uniref:hypothetical protein n=1 Tax=Streptomyces sp. NPDC051561 TaxID=3365658 RepID=UPI00378912BE